MKRIELIASVVEDEWQLDGSRHVGVACDLDGAEAAIYFVLDHDSVLVEADMSMELNGEMVSIEFDSDQGMVNWDELDFNLHSDRAHVEAHGRADGDLDVILTMYGADE